MINPDKYSGCLLGLAIGDAYGAPFEGGPIERLLWKVIGTTKDGKLRYTDDTQMSIDLASSFIRNNGINQEHLATVFAENYRWSRGYGPSAARLLKKIRNGARWQDVNRARFKEGSYGNGAAMRAPVLAMCHPDNQEELNESIIKSSEITHAHPLAIEGAKLVALTTCAALHDWSTDAILEAMPSWCRLDEYQARVSFCIESIQAPGEIHDHELKNRLGNGIAASQSTVTAVYFALKYREQSLDTMLAKIYQLGGDTDTIGAMAGATWGAFNGREPIDTSKIKKIEDSARIIEISEQLYAISVHKEIQ